MKIDITMKKDLSYTIKEIIEQRFDEMGTHLTEIKADAKETKAAVQFQNGRVTKLEEWSNEAKTIIDNASKGVKNYVVDKAKVWVAIGILTILGGTIITLAIMAIDNKIDTRVNEAVVEYQRNFNQ